MALLSAWLIYRSIRSMEYYYTAIQYKSVALADVQNIVAANKYLPELTFTLAIYHLLCVC